MKLTQYTRQERAIAAADSSGIRERWLWGLRLLADQEKTQPSGRLRDGVREALIQAAAKRGIKLSDSEIGYRSQCARAYPTEAHLATIVARFATWTELREAGFPQVEVSPNEPAADWRTKPEQDHDRARALADLIGDQGTLFPLSRFEPVETTLGDLDEYAKEQEALTANFIEHGRKRREYLDAMISAAGGDLSVTWADAHDAAFA